MKYAVLEAKFNDLVNHDGNMAEVHEVDTLDDALALRQELMDKRGKHYHVAVVLE